MGNFHLPKYWGAPHIRMGGGLACFPAPPPFLMAWCFRLGAPVCGKGGRDGKGFLSQQPGSRKTGQCHLLGSRCP